jgi:hypothetical protein
MQTWVWIVIAVVVIALVVAAVVGVQQQRRRRLRDTFGPEYDRTVGQADNRRDAERELEGRFQRRQKLDIRALDEEQRDRYAAQWQNVQARFVDTPVDAVQEADTLVAAVMRDRGYPVADFEQRAADVSVDHPGLVDNYRGAHGIAQRCAAGSASTEDMRVAMVHYRALFQDLLGGGAEARDGERARAR